MKRIFSLLVLASGIASAHPTIPDTYDRYGGTLSAISGPIRAKLLHDDGRGDVLVVGYTNIPSDIADVLGVVLNGRWIGEYRGFDHAARGDDVTIDIPSENLENGVIEFYVRKRSGTYDSNYGQNYKFILQR